MNEYMIRIELYDAKSNDYDALHFEMADFGFLTTVENTLGTYKLPRAEYYIKTSLLIMQVLTNAKIAINKTGRNGEVVISEFINITWDNLPKV